jgi:hypothetical protein
VWIDGAKILCVSFGKQAKGRVGLFCEENKAAYFDNISVDFL